MKAARCPLCDAAGGHLVFSGGKFRVVRADEAGFPAFYRVVWNEHLPEFTDLDAADRAVCMEAVAGVESALREHLQHLQPAKINVASLGNVVPHLHWHVIARFDWDSHFPSPVWAQSRRPLDADLIAQVKAHLPEVEKALCTAFRNGRGNCTAP
jgi:diadenosine tetraphosphate (Ap4A) HIT family hydrolase